MLRDVAGFVSIVRDRHRMTVMPPLVIGALAFFTMLALGEGSLARSVGGRLTRGRVQLVEPSDPRARDRSRNLVGGSLVTTVVAGAVGLRVAGLPGLLAGPVAGAVLARARRRRRSRQRKDALERQLAEFVESSALAVRTGYSVIQAIEFAASEAEEPMAGLALQMFEERRVGVPFDDALEHFGTALNSEDARLFTLIVRIHSKSGGNLAGALEEVGATIRHRISVRRELRAFTAQGRVSGAILGSLPIGFFIVLALTSRRELAPVYRSSAGISMIALGLVMEALAFVWIRRLLQVEV